MSDSPSSSSTASDDILPTPHMGSGEMTSDVNVGLGLGGHTDKPDIFSPTLSSPSQSPAIPVAPPISSMPMFSRTKSSSRAPAPPPILLRRPTDNLPTAKGLNINLNSPTYQEEDYREDAAEEELDGVPDLIPSPRRASFAAQLRNGEHIPMSPAWQSLDSPISSGSSRMPTTASFGQGLVPPSPLIGYSPSQSRLSPMMTGSPGPSSRSSGKRFDPTPTHGIHARNMSLFFPQPGADGAQGLGIPMEAQEEAGVQVIPQANKKPFGGQGEWKFGAEPGAAGQDLASPQAKSKRRGHHHKHSLSHNFFSFLDPTLTNPQLAPSTSVPDLPLTPKPADTPTSVPMPMSSISAQSPSLSPLPRSSDPMSQLLASFACLEFLIGAALWVEGQMGGWRSLAGVGYLVVFDALGVAVGVVARGGEGWRSVRRPYGTTRFLSLLYFSQSLFLVFAAVYIAKESIEQVVLGASGNEHGGHGHSHGHVDLDGEERPFPTFLLLCATLASALGGGMMHTHTKLVDAVGSLFLSPTYLSSSIVRRFPHLLANPFSVTVMGASAAVLIGTLIVPASSLHTFDALAALLLTVLTTALSLPASKAFGQVLLQTAPPASTSQMKNLQRVIKDISADHRVRSITHTRCWAITAGSSPPPPLETTPPPSPHSRQPSYSALSPTAWRSPSGSPTVGEFGGIHHSQYPSLLKSESDAPLVITMELEVDEDIGDRDLLDVTRTVWGKLSKVCRSGNRSSAGEVSVGIKRAKDSGGHGRHVN